MTIEGNLALDDYDIFAEVGGFKGVVKSFTVSNTDGNLDIDFIKVKQNPQIQAIEIRGEGGGGPINAAPTVNAGTDQTITLPAGATLAGTASDDGLPAGSTLTTTWSKFSGPGTVTFGNANQLEPQRQLLAVRHVRAAPHGQRRHAVDDRRRHDSSSTPPAPAMQRAGRQRRHRPDDHAPGHRHARRHRQRRRPARGQHADHTWSKFSGPGTVTFGNAGPLETTASFSARRHVRPAPDGQRRHALQHRRRHRSSSTPRPAAAGKSSTASRRAASR